VQSSGNHTKTWEETFLHSAPESHSSLIIQHVDTDLKLVIN
jgi:hypothetical protein